MSEPTEIAVVKNEITMTARGLQLRSLDDAWRFAQAVIKSGLAPQQFGTPEKVLIAIQHGAEVGLTPVQSLHSIAVINGRPSLYGDALPALAWASGVLEELDETLEGTGEKMVAVCKTTRKGQQSPCVTRFSVDDAKRAGLWGKAGPWKQYPQRMLQMRARSWNFRDNLADVLKGLHVTEEVADFQPNAPVRVEQAATVSLDDFDAPDEVIDVDPPDTESAGGLTEADKRFIVLKEDIESSTGDALLAIQAEVKLASIPEKDRQELFRMIDEKMG